MLTPIGPEAAAAKGLGTFKCALSRLWNKITGGAGKVDDVGNAIGGGRQCARPQGEYPNGSANFINVSAHKEKREPQMEHSQDFDLQWTKSKMR